MGRAIGLLLAICILAPVTGCTAAPPQIESTTKIEDTTDTVGPYLVHSVILDVRPGDRAEVFYNVDDGPRYFPLVMEEQANGELFVGAIPGRPVGSRISYYIAVSRDGVRLVADPPSAGALPYAFVIKEALDLP